MALRPYTDIFGVLAKHRVPFVLIGGHAVIYYGYLRATEDVDIIWHRTTENESALLAALGEINARWISNEIDPATGLEREVPVTASYLQSTHLMMLITDCGFLDLFDYVPGIPDLEVDELFVSKRTSQPWPVVSLSLLRRMKQAAGRQRDLEDLTQLPAE